MGAELANTFPAAAIAQLDFNDVMATGGTVPSSRQHTEHGRLTYHINFAGKQFRRYAVWKPLPFWKKV